MSGSLIDQYIEGGRLPWSPGYSKFKNKIINEVLNDSEFMEKFRLGSPLPEGYGARLDERVVEYPWTLSRLRSDGYFMDAGSTYNSPMFIDHPKLAERKFLICTFWTDWITLNPRISYLFNDLRETILKNDSFESIVCISTLEHIGLGLDIRKYNMENPWEDADYSDYKRALKEFNRLLKPGGQLLLTVPFGRYENHGWLQQYDSSGVKEIKAAFGGETVVEQYYRYDESGWHSSSAKECSDERYYNLHAENGFDKDFAAAARSVVCLELKKAGN